MSIGTVTVDSEVYTLDDSGVWTGPSDMTVYILNDQFSPNDPAIGDHHLPYGAGSVYDAAKYLDGEADVTATQIPLEEGMVS